MVAVSVEYCGGWWEAAAYQELARLIAKTVPQADITGFIGRKSSFEVKVDRKIIYSKLKTKAYPDFKAVVGLVKGVEEGVELGMITKTQSSCTIL